jgi:hypothetical protein
MVSTCTSLRLLAVMISSLFVFFGKVGNGFVAVQLPTLHRIAPTSTSTVSVPHGSLRQLSTISSTILWMVESSNDDADPASIVSDVEEAVADAVFVSPSSDGESLEISTVTKWKSIISFYKNSKKTEDDGLTFRQRLAKAGLSVVLSYGFVSNMSYCVSVSVAWYIFCKRTMLSPLAPGQWPKFLAVYSGFWVFNNIVRPIRFGLSVGISTQFEKVVQFIQDKFNANKSVAIGLTVFFANVVGTTTLMCLGISIAASLAGVPIRPAR